MAKPKSPKSGSRKLFEEVGDAQQPTTQSNVIARQSSSLRPRLRLWFVILLALVVVMILVGGLTRLTDSGLSITEWDLFKGVLPPLNEAAWAEMFEKYKTTGEYQQQNAGMSLEEFKFIFFWEWGHRFLGRVIGLVWAIGFVYFWAKKALKGPWMPRALVIGGLIMLQGAIGWWMVQSGLHPEMLDVASYRLAIHLGLAFVILALLYRNVLFASRPEAALIQARRAAEPRIARWGAWLIGLAFVQILLGALVAGIDAGRAFPTWPDMGGSFFPPFALELEPVWRNFFENAGLVQFNHRMVGYLLFAVAIAALFALRKSPNPATRLTGSVLVAVMALQVVIGIMTVLYSAPLWLAIIHQFGAILVWLTCVRVRVLGQFPISSSLREA